MKHAIPPAILEQHAAFLGKTGSGKTSTAKLAVEQIVRDNPNARVCVLDTLKSDWWGLTSSADGKKPGLPFYILGGPRGHVPLHDSAGKAIGELVATGALPLSIIDMADFAPGGVQKFFNDFAPALMKKMRGMVYLVIEEAHEIAPKERAGFNAENMAIHWAKKLATAGRSKGIRLLVVTQRTQALHNAVLGSCDTMIAHRLTAPADQEPVKKWLKANVSKDVFEKVSESLSSLKTGSAWICSGEAQIADLVQFPKITTYDNSATPTGDSADLDIKTAAVDRDKLRAIIGEAVADEEANDPAKLRSQIAALEKQLSASSAPSGVHEVAVNAAHFRGREEGYSLGLKAGFDEARRLAAAALTDRKAIIAARVAEVIDTIDSDLGIAPSFSESASPPVPTRALPDAAQKRAPSPAAQRVPSPAASGDASLTNPQRNLLRSLAWWRTMGQYNVTRAQLAVVCGWSPASSNVRDRLSEVSKLGLVEYPDTGMVRLTDAGIAAAPSPDTSTTLIDSIKSILTNPQRLLFESLLSAHHERIAPVSRSELATACGWSPDSSNVRDRLSELSRLELVEYPRSGMVALQQWVLG